MLQLTLVECLKVQLAKYNSDWNAIKPIILGAGATGLEYKYNWAIVNSRCYYWGYAKGRKPPKGEKLARDDCLALCPWGDYFNHSDKGVCEPSSEKFDIDSVKCRVQLNKTGYVVIANRDYRELIPRHQTILTVYRCGRRSCCFLWSSSK
jgi:hypothetical protein